MRWTIVKEPKVNVCIILRTKIVDIGSFLIEVYKNNERLSFFSETLNNVILRYYNIHRCSKRHKLNKKWFNIKGEMTNIDEYK